jgi:hypothetical protein
VNVFVNYEKYDQNGHLIVPQNKNNEGDEDLDSEEEEEEIDYEKDEDDEKQITNKFTVDMVAY